MRKAKTTAQQAQQSNRNHGGQYEKVAERCEVPGCRGVVQYEITGVAEGAGYSEKIGGSACAECFEKGVA